MCFLPPKQKQDEVRDDLTKAGPPLSPSRNTVRRMILSHFTDKGVKDWVLGLCDVKACAFPLPPMSSSG